MKTIKTILLLIFINLSAYAQYDDYLSISVYSSVDVKHESVGLELRGDFDTWYIAMRGERFTNKSELLKNWGFTVGKIWRESYFTFLVGAGAGIMVVDNENKPLFCAESEIDYHVTNRFFIGVRCGYVRYMDSPNIQTPITKKLLRGFIKIGYNI